ncbi:MAG: SDR family oxidoreductase [Pseudomonadota bacterium]
MERLKGKKALITGGAQGLGACFAHMFADEGAKVAVTDINADGAEATAASINEKHPGAAISFSHDVTDQEHWKRALAGTAEAFDGLSVLVNNAGIGTAGNIETETFENFQRIQDVDVGSIFIGTQLAMPYLRNNTPGSIVNIASVAAYIANGDSLSYNVAKAGVVMMTKSIALHCTKQKLDIRCNSICPAFTRTPIIDPLIAFAGGDEAAEQKLVKGVPMRRIADPEEIGFTAIFLASDESRFVTATEIRVDGGMTAK